MEAEVCENKVIFPIPTQIIQQRLNSFTACSVQIKQQICKNVNSFSNNTNSTIRKYSTRAFIWVVTPLGFVGQFRI